MTNVRRTLARAIKIVKDNKLIFILCCLIFDAIIIVLLVCHFMINPYKQYVLGSNPQVLAQNIDTGIVLGAGVAPSGKPYKELQARLDVAADALAAGRVKQLVLSGDNRFEYYNEPAAMQRYLVQERKVPADALILDYAGRSTYESCERAIKVFGVHRAVIFSAESHLPRAIYLCRHFGVEAYGVSSGVEANNSWRRELVARVKAVFNIYIYGEKTIL